MSSPIPVAAIGSGNVGRHALIQLITDPRFELTAVWVSSESKAGKDAAELAGLQDSTGIVATTDLDAVLATNPPARCTPRWPTTGYRRRSRVVDMRGTAVPGHNDEITPNAPRRSRGVHGHSVPARERYPNQATERIDLR